MRIILKWQSRKQGVREMHRDVNAGSRESGVHASDGGGKLLKWNNGTQWIE